MPPDRGQRISNAIDSLITHLIPVDPKATDEKTREHHDACFELVQSILDTCDTFAPLPPRGFCKLTFPQP